MLIVKEAKAGVGLMPSNFFTNRCHPELRDRAKDDIILEDLLAIVTQLRLAFMNLLTELHGEFEYAFAWCMRRGGLERYLGIDERVG